MQRYLLIFGYSFALWVTYPLFYLNSAQRATYFRFTLAGRERPKQTRA